MSVRPSAAPGPLTEIVDAGGPHLPALLERVEQRLVELAAQGGATLSAPAGDTMAAGGKRLRPLLVLVAAGDCPPDPDGLVRAAVAVELVHAATLVHDDVLDVAALRRGQATVFAAAGREVATATGDFLFAQAFAELAANDRPAEVQALSQAGSALARGELLQRADAWNAEVGVERYLERCELKTARLFEAACRLGALEAGGDPDWIGAFGRKVGLAFQILDDVLDVSGPPERTGKHRGTDLLDGTITLPFILARDADPHLAALDPRTVTTPERAAEVCDAIAATGALDVARERALGIVAQAKRELPELLAAPQRRALELVATGVVARYS